VELQLVLVVVVVVESWADDAILDDALVHFEVDMDVDEAQEVVDDLQDQQLVGVDVLVDNLDENLAVDKVAWDIRGIVDILVDMVAYDHRMELLVEDIHIDHEEEEYENLEFPFLDVQL
jgi:hypothetical protein